MSRYTTPSQVRLILEPDLRGQDTSTETASQLDDEQLWAAIEQASATIDGYLAVRYTVPVAPVDTAADPLTYPDPVNQWCRGLAAYEAQLILFRSAPMQPTEPVYLRMVQIMQSLVAVSKGLMVLQIPESSDTGSGDGFAGVVDNPNYDCLFGPDDIGAHPASGRLQ